MSALLATTARVCDIPVRESVFGETKAVVLRFDQPIVGDDNAEYEFGIALTTRGIVDVLAMDPARPGFMLPDPEPGFGFGWVSLLNCSLLNRRSWTLEGFLASCGIEVVR